MSVSWAPHFETQKHRCYMREDTRIVTLSNITDERSVRRSAVRNAIGKLVSYLWCLAGSFIMLLPLAWLFRSSIMSPGQIFSFPPEWFPNPFGRPEKLWLNRLQAISNYTKMIRILEHLCSLPQRSGNHDLHETISTSDERARWKVSPPVLLCML